MLQQLQLIAEHLMKGDDYPCTNTKRGVASCIMAEEKRPLSKSEKLRGDHVRTWNAYNPDMMCCTCRAYWHTTMAAQALERFETLKKLEEREKARTA